MELQTIQNKIYEIRGLRVMLDFDLAELYQVPTKALKQAVKRNIERFEGDDFMFELSESEYNALKDRLRSQIVTLEIDGRGKYPKYSPFAFTEEGVAMLAGVLRSPVAIQINRAIMRAFVRMRNYLTQISPTTVQFDDLRKRIERLEQVTYTHSTLQTFSTQTRIIDYSEKSLVIFPFRKADIKLLKQIGASYNPWLSIKGVHIAGWIFPKSRQHELQQLIHNNRIIQ